MATAAIVKATLQAKKIQAFGVRDVGSFHGHGKRKNAKFSVK